MNDGTIVFSTELDNKGLEKELARLNKKIKGLEEELRSYGEKKLPLQKQLDELGVQADAAAAKLYEMQNAVPGTFSTQQIKDQAETARYLGGQYDAAAKALINCNNKIAEGSAKLAAAKEEAGGIQQQLAKTGPAARAMAKAMVKAEKSAQRFSLRLREVLRSALLFTLLSQGLAKFRDWMGKVIKTNDEATAAIAQLKGALLTLAQPLVEIIIPAFVALVNILTCVISTIAQLFAMLTGKSIQSIKDAAKALDKETEALENTGAAADDAAGSLAGFDEINTINTETASGGSADSISPDFDFASDLSEGQLGRILDLVKAIGAAFLAWKIGKALGMDMGKIIGLALAIYSAVQFVQNLFDAWTDGVNWDNLLGMLSSAAGLAVGLGIAFGSVAAGVSLIVTGLAMLATGFHDAMENGWNLENTLLTIAGIFATGLGISLITGSFIPALIGGIAALLIALTVATGHGEELLDGVRTMLEGFKDFFVGIFTGDIEKAVGGIEKIFDGLGLAVGAIISGVEDTFLGFLYWLEEKTGADLSHSIEDIKALFQILRDFLGGNIDGIKDIFAGLVKFIAGVFTNDWDRAWEGVKQIFKGIINQVITIAEGMVNGIIAGINSLIRGFNKILSLGDGVAEKLFGFTVRVNELSRISIPRLATGAVIPPNREFLAVLGDQTSGNNIEAPESLIRQIVREEAGGMNTELLQAILEAIKAGRVMKVNGKVMARAMVHEINNLTDSAGEPVLKF